MDERAGPSFKRKFKFSSDDEDRESRPGQSNVNIRRTIRLGREAETTRPAAAAGNFQQQGAYVKPLQASDLTKKQIEEFFPDIEFACPTNTRPGDDLNGTTDSEILEDLLRDMRSKRFPMSANTPEDIQAVRTKTGLDVGLAIEPLVDCLEMVTDAGNTIPEVRASYQKLLDALRDVASSSFKSSTARWAVPMINRLRDFIEASMSTANTDPHGYLLKFWGSVLAIFEGPHLDGNKETDVIAKPNGDGPAIHVDLKVAKPYACQHGHHKPRKVEHADASDLESQRLGLDKVYVQISCKPDTVMSATESKTLDSGKKVSEEKAKFVLEAKTSKKAVGTNHGVTKYKVVSSPQLSAVSLVGSTGTDTSAYEHDPDYRTTEISPTDHYRLESSSFCEIMIELLGTMRVWTTQKAHMIGLYCVMHRVYIVCLHVETNNVAAENERVFKGIFINNVYYDKYSATLHRADKKQKTSAKFRLVCTKPFNILKTGQFEALIHYIQYLLFKKEEYF